MRHGFAGILSLLLLCMAFLLGGCSEQEEPKASEAEYEKVRLVMTMNGTDIGIETLTARRFAELVAEESGGNVRIEVYPNDELAGGNTNEGVRQVTEGAVDMGAYVSGTMSLLDVRLEVATIPWTFSSYREARKVIDETGGAYYEKPSMAWCISVPRTMPCGSSPATAIPCGRWRTSGA